MERSDYDKQLLRWVRDHYWDSLEKDKDLILRHLRTFAGDEDASQPSNSADREITVINEHGDIESGPDIDGLKRDPGR